MKFSLALQYRQKPILTFTDCTSRNHFCTWMHEYIFLSEQTKQKKVIPFIAQNVVARNPSLKKHMLFSHINVMILENLQKFMKIKSSKDLMVCRYHFPILIYTAKNKVNISLNLSYLSNIYSTIEWIYDYKFLYQNLIKYVFLYFDWNWSKQGTLKEV